MPYVPKVWQDLPSTSTPITAVSLNKMESGIKDAVDTAELAMAEVLLPTDQAVDAGIDRADLESKITTLLASDAVVKNAATAAMQDAAVIAQVNYRGLWAGAGDMDEWRTAMRGTWEVRDATGYARPTNFPPNVAATVPSLVSIDTTAGGHTIQTVYPTGNGMSVWWRTSKTFSGTGLAAWNEWKRVDSQLRPRLANGTNLDTLRLQASEGLYSITQTQGPTLTGLPHAAAFGSLSVQPSLDGVATQTMWDLSESKARVWWRMVNNASTFTWSTWVLLSASGAETVVTAPLALTAGGGPTPTLTADIVHGRLPVRPPVTIRRWRAHLRNYNYRDAQAYAGALSFTGLVVGPAALDAQGRPTGAFASAPTQVMGAAVSPSNAAELATPWTSIELVVGQDYLVAYAYTGATGQVSYLATGGGWLGSDSSTLAALAPTLVKQQYMPLDVWLEVECDPGTPVVAYFGDSLTIGVAADLPMYDSYPMRHAQAHGHLPVVYGASGSAMNLWTNAGSGQITRWAGFTKPDRLYWSMGSNDIFQPVDIATLRARFAAAWPVITGATSRNVILTTILPRLNAAAAAEAVRKEWNAILTDELPGGAVMTVDAAASVTASDAGTLDTRWRADAGNLHMSKQGYAKFASTLP